MRKGHNGGGKKWGGEENKIKTSLVATNIGASRPPECQPTRIMLLFPMLFMLMILFSDITMTFNLNTALPHGHSMISETFTTQQFSHHNLQQ